MEDYKNQLKKYYDTDAENRDHYPKKSWKIKARDRFLYYLLDENVETLLEIGAGSGSDALLFQKNGLKITASDLSEENIEKCREKGLNAFVLDFYNMGLPSHSFDSLYGINCLLHVPHSDTASVLKEISRIVKIDGLIFLGLNGGKNWEGIVEGKLGSRFISFHTFEDYQTILLDYFDVIEEKRILLQKKDYDFHYFILRNNIKYNR